MSNVLGLCGSPVKGSSTELLIQETLRGAASQGAVTDFIMLNELQIMPCQACGKAPETGYCFFHDGMDKAYERFDWCDSIIIGSPIYFDSVSAQTKLFIDRTNCFRAMSPGGEEPFVQRITKRRAGGIILVGGEADKMEYARRIIGGFFVWANVESKGIVSFAHDSFEKGGVASRPEILRQAFDLGVRLASKNR
jgi:multimeric flavodoxin WrbA